MSDSTPKTTLILNADTMHDVVCTLASLLVDRHGRSRNFALVGIQRRGVVIANRLAQRMEAQLGLAVPTGSLDITLYRDDWTSSTPKPFVGQTRIQFDVADKILILVDDVLFTGRTARAALEALADFGRPSKVELLVLVDRGHREVPIHPDYTGLVMETRKQDHVDVLVKEIDDQDGVFLITQRD